MSKTLTLIVIALFFLSTGCADNGEKNSKNEISRKSENYQNLTSDGSWCWFSDPRAVYYEGDYKRTYASWVDSKGSVVVGFYDHNSREINSQIIAENFEVDDHNNPGLLFDPTGKLLLFFSKHSTAEPMLMYKMTNPEDISTWEKTVMPVNDKTFYKGNQSTYTYANPVMLSAENNRIFVFWRGMDYKPNYTYSDDLGKTWSPGRILILPENIYSLRRPYLKVTSNRKDRIAFAFTDGHPRKENENSIYYMYYSKDAFYNARNEKIKNIGNPVAPNETTIVYNASISKKKAWIWDVALDKNDNPVIVYAKFPDDENHIYSYSRWDGEKWISSDLVNSGKWFPETEDGTTEREPNYSGGIVVDHENTNEVYLSVKRGSYFEIEKWINIDDNDWIIEPITNNSNKNNVRPFAVLNAEEGNPLQVLWMQNEKYIHYTDYYSSIKMNIFSQKLPIR